MEKMHKTFKQRTALTKQCHVKTHTVQNQPRYLLSCRKKNHTAVVVLELNDKNSGLKG